MKFPKFLKWFRRAEGPAKRKPGETFNHGTDRPVLVTAQESDVVTLCGMSVAEVLDFKDGVVGGMTLVTCTACRTVINERAAGDMVEIPAEIAESMQQGYEMS